MIVSALRRSFRILVGLLATLCAAIVTYLLAALGLGIIPLNAHNRPSGSGIDVYLYSNGVHTDLIVPIHSSSVDWTARLPIDAVHPIAGFTESLAFGWGDRGVYLSTPTWSDLRVGTAVAALTGWDTSVLHVEAGRLTGTGASTRHVELSDEQYRRLVDFIDASFQTDAHGAKIIIPGIHYGTHDAFFEARGHYSAFVTCNEWVRRGLAQAGVRVPVWALRHGPVLSATTEPLRCGDRDSSSGKPPQ